MIVAGPQIVIAAALGLGHVQPEPITVRDTDVTVHVTAKNAKKLAPRALARLAKTRADVLALLADPPKPAPAGGTSSGAGRARPDTARFAVWLVRDAAAARATCRREIGLELRGIGMLRAGSRACVHVDLALNRSDKLLDGALAHTAARLTMRSLRTSRPERGWLFAGFAHYFEARANDGRSATTGFGERILPHRYRWPKDDLLAAARALAESEALRPIAQLAALQDEELDVRDHAHCRALVEFAVETLARDRLRVLFRSDGSATALGTAFGCEPAELDRRLAAWLRGE